MDKEDVRAMTGEVWGMQRYRGWGAGQHEGVGGSTWVGKCVKAGGHISQGQEMLLGHIGVGGGLWCMGPKVHGGW